MSVTHVLILPDIHLPYEDKRSLGAVLNYAATKHWDECVQLGDFVDMNSVSSHNKGKPLLVEGERLADDYAYANEFLDCLTQAVRAKNPKCKITLLKGNHEYRVDRYIEEHPALEGMIETKVGLRLKERGIQQINCYPGGELYKIGKLTFTHGYWCNEHHAKKHADYYGCSIVYGHTHTVQEFSKVLHGPDSTILGLSLGTLSLYQLDYLEGRPSAWQHAFGEAHFQENGFFNTYPIRIFDGGFVSPDGQAFTHRNPVKAKR